MGRGNKRFPDVQRVGNSHVVPFVPGEGYRERHKRRLGIACETEADLRDWCAEHEITLNVSNEGHHWRFTLPGGTIAEWWPSTAKFVWEKRYRRGIHVYDWTQVRAQLMKRAARRPRVAGSAPKGMSEDGPATR